MNLKCNFTEKLVTVAAKRTIVQAVYTSSACAEGAWRSDREGRRAEAQAGLINWAQTPSSPIPCPHLY